MNMKKLFLVGLGLLCLPPLCGCKNFYTDTSPEIQKAKKDEMLTVNLDGTKNTRDLGGYKTSCGTFTKYNLFFRSDNTDKLTDSDIKKLRDECNLKTVIDLRYNREVSAFPDKLSTIRGIKYYNIPLLIPKEQMVSLVKGDIDLGDAYIESLNQKDMVKKIFDTIAETTDGSILFHCTNGKDRTGTVAALLLGLCGVSKEDVADNYSVTYELIKENESVKKGIQKYGTDTIFKSPPEYIGKLFDYVINTYGSFENYLLDCGVSQQNLEKIKDRFQN